MAAERYQVFELMPQYNPQMYQRIRELLRPLLTLQDGRSAFANCAYGEGLGTAAPERNRTLEPRCPSEPDTSC